jgi:curved DNA-binding protein
LEFKDYYATLGVDKSASKDEVQRAYRKLARKYHPDINKEPEAEARFKDIGEAYEVLKDPDKRTKYDRYGTAWKQAQARPGGGAPSGFEEFFVDFGGGQGGVRFESGGMGGMGGEGFSSFFDMLFGGGRSGGAGGRPGAGGGPRAAQWSHRGSDQELEVQISLAEAARGGKREIVATDPESGERKSFTVKIPQGVRSGQRIRLAGKGGAGSGGGPAGDLYLRLRVTPDPRFRLDKRDLHTTLPVAPWEAALGGEATLDTLDGPVRVKIPRGSSSGRKIRLKGKGFPSRNSDAGDLYAEISVAVPTELNDEEEKLYRELAEASSFRPRG